MKSAMTLERWRPIYTAHKSPSESAATVRSYKLQDQSGLPGNSRCKSWQTPTAERPTGELLTIWL